MDYENTTIQYNYPIYYNIEYNNEKEYRKCMREVFQMNPENYPQDMSEYDDETKDEMEYDEKAVSNAIYYIMNLTEKEPLFQELYLLSAATILSEDIMTGMMILFSFDNLAQFHNILKIFFNPELYDTKEYRDIMTDKINLLKDCFIKK